MRGVGLGGGDPPLPGASSFEPAGLTAHIQYGAGSTDAQRLMGATPTTGTKLKAPPRSSLPDGAFPASPFGWLYVFQPVGTSPRSGGAFSLPCVPASGGMATGYGKHMKLLKKSLVLADWFLPGCFFGR